MPSKGWEEITHPFPNVNSYSGEIWEWISIFTPLYIWCYYSSMVGLKLTRVNKMAPCYLCDVHNDQPGLIILELAANSRNIQTWHRR